MAVGFSDDQLMVSCLTGLTACHTQGPGGLTEIYTGSLRPKVQPLNALVYTILDRKGTLSSCDKWYPFHILSLELCIPFNECK